MTQSAAVSQIQAGGSSEVSKGAVLSYLFNQFVRMYPGEKISEHGSLIILGYTMMIMDHKRKAERDQVTRECVESMYENKAAMCEVKG